MRVRMGVAVGMGVIVVMVGGGAIAECGSSC